MRHFILLIVLLSSSIGRSGDCKERAQVAIAFLNQYIAFREKSVKAGQTMNTEGWLGSNQLVTKGFISSYKAEEAKGLAQDPELGWDSDVVLDSQDYPDKGVKFLRCLDQRGYVLLQGVDWPEFTVIVRVVTTKNGLKVVGSGVVNIPGYLRAKQK
ncbi:MAG: hypothetical protein HYZ13_06075 [Acidobacteria bacterium]|nr:hypothetical protein [Acidobacteriota bacterium]